MNPEEKEKLLRAIDSIWGAVNSLHECFTDMSLQHPMDDDLNAAGDALGQAQDLLMELMPK